MITALCNVYINSDTKLSLFKETFPTVFTISDNWLINIRGKFKTEVLKMIKDLPDKKGRFKIFQNLNDNDWAESTRNMLQYSKYNHVYIYLEDHFLQTSLEHFQEVLKEAIKINSDFIPYSFFNIGMSPQSTELYEPMSSPYFSSFNISSRLTPLLRKHNSNFYPISLVGIFSKALLMKVLSAENRHKIFVHPYIQLILQNVIFLYPRNRQLIMNINKYLPGMRLVIYTPKSPMNIERSIFDLEESLLPYKISILKQELFANWDDDNGQPNLSLIKRGLYPRTLVVKEEDIKKPQILLPQIVKMKKGDAKTFQYHPETGRIVNLPKKEIKVNSGKIQVKGSNEKYIVNSGKKLILCANIPHVITALENAEYESLIYF